MSQRTLAREVGVSASHLSRVLRGASYKSPSRDLVAKVARAFGLPEDYFPEYREAVVIERVRRDAGWRDRLYRQVRGRA